MPKRPAPTVPAASPTSAPAPLVAAAVYLHVSALRPNPRNPRMHGEEAVRLARTILRTAWGAPIVAQARSRRIIGGHGRLEAALRILASLEVDSELRGGPEHFFDKDAPGPGMVPVRLVDVSDAEADAMTAADNARALQGTDDSVRVLELLAPFGRGTTLLADIGFDDRALDGLVEGAGDAALHRGFAWRDDRPIIDEIGPEADFNEVTGALASVGLGTVPSWLRPFGVLSNGEKFRAELARILIDQPERVVVDEFTSVVDRQIAQVGAAAFAKAWRPAATGQAVLLSCRYDIVEWLQPDWLLDTREWQFGWRSVQRPPRIDVDVLRTNWSAWRFFSRAAKPT